KALDDYIAASELDPREPVIWYNRATTHAQLSQYDQAIPAFAKLIDLKPLNPVAWYNLAMLELQRGDLPGYRKVCFRMLERFERSTDRDAGYWITWTCALAPDAVADWTRPLQLAAKVYADHGRNYDLINNLGAVLYRAGRYKEAAQRLTEAEAA